MGKCKCKNRTRIVSDVVNSMDGKCCRDVCVDPICGEPDVLSLMAPLIYDEIGINLCATFTSTVVLPAGATVDNASIRAINATFTDGAGGVTIAPIPGRPNCTEVTMTDITVQFALNLYDANCNLITTTYPTAVYLPPGTDAETYDADTNPNTVTLELFTPYGVSYDTTVDPPTPVINYVGFSETNDTVSQGLNMYTRAKLLDFDITGTIATLTVGLTFIIQSLYFAGYKVKSEGKLDTPKGSLITPENSDCMRFVAGELLDLAIKPLDLGWPNCEQRYKRACRSNVNTCGGDCSGNDKKGRCQTCNNLHEGMENMSGHLEMEPREEGPFLRIGSIDEDE